MKTVLAVALLLNGAAACTSGQDGTTRTDSSAVTSPISETLPADTTRLSATLLRRLGEAADGFRDGADRYVVATREFPHKVAGAFLTRAEADAVAEVRSSVSLHYGVFGPYRTMPDSLAEGPEDVLYVTVKTRGGKETRYYADSVDALFWSLSAFDKFIAPNLTAVSGPLYAAEQRELYRRGRSPLTHSSAIPHYRGSL
jgi:hypothetical protein